MNERTERMYDWTNERTGQNQYTPLTILKYHYEKEKDMIYIYLYFERESYAISLTKAAIVQEWLYI